MKRITKLRFKEFVGEWEEKRLGEVCNIIRGVQLNKDLLSKTGKYPALNGGILPSGYTENWNVEANTISISGGGSCGFVNFVTEKFWSGGHNYSLQKIITSVSPVYLYQMLKYYEPSVMNLSVGSGLKNIQKYALFNFKIPFPQLPEQTKIANFLNSIDSKIDLLQKQISLTKDFKKSLLQQMFV